MPKEVLRQFETDDGQTVTKYETSFGGTLYTAEGEGQINQQEYSAKSAQRTVVQKRDKIEAGTLDESELPERYQATSTFPTGGTEPGSAERFELEQKNMFAGYLFAEDTPDDRLQAVEEYTEMQKRLRQADSQAEQREIKEDYNIGGS